MPLVVVPPSPSASGPQYTPLGGRVICRFGNGNYPNGQGVMPWLDLNDLAQWFLMRPPAIQDNRQMTHGQRVWLAEGVWLGDDFGPKTLRLPFELDERGGSQLPLSYWKGVLGQASDQFLTFDGVAQIPAMVRSFGQPEMIRRYQPYRWALTIEFLSKTPWAQDIAASTIASQSVAAAAATSFNVTYAGGVYAKPVWTVTVPNTNPAAISSLTLANTMSGETLVVTLGLAALTAYTLTIDCGEFSVVDQTGHQYATTGSFPRLYPPPGQSNPFTAQLGVGSGTPAGVTIVGSYFNRWDL